MGGILYAQLGSAIAGVLLTAAIAYALIKYSPPPWRNTIFGAFAVALFAISTGSKVDISMNQEKGLEIKVSELTNELDRLKEEAKELRTSQQEMQKDIEAKLAAKDRSLGFAQAADLERLEGVFAMLENRELVLTKRVEALNTSHDKLTQSLKGLVSSTNIEPIQLQYSGDRKQWKNIIAVDPQEYEKAKSILKELKGTPNKINR